MHMRCEHIDRVPQAEVFSGRVAILIPAYNEAAHLGALLDACQRVRPALALVVDDGSTDATGQVLEQARLRLGSSLALEVICSKRNLGKQGAVRLGLRALVGRDLDAVCLIDGDGQHDPAELPSLAGLLERFDLVIGARSRAEMPLQRRLSNWLVNRGFEWIGGVDFADLQSGLRIYRASLVEVLADRLPPRGGYALEHESLTLLARYARDKRMRLRVAAAPASCRYGQATSSMRTGHVLDLAVQTVRQALRFRQASRALDPARAAQAWGHFEEFALRNGPRT
jgi:glycosyltransferase involved in cell wall biosynthesis